eukprot:COSAG06_NODE_1246_length_10113_cov_21.479629_9_plen_67_part_00
MPMRSPTLQPFAQPRYISTQLPFVNAPDELCMIIAVGFVVSASHELLQIKSSRHASRTATKLRIIN